MLFLIPVAVAVAIVSKKKSAKSSSPTITEHYMNLYVTTDEYLKEVTKEHEVVRAQLIARNQEVEALLQRFKESHGIESL